jgi:prolyl-tRNA editing enzyme YbaK/EbsC (Cys-tRNA(Pro) deacylase)
MGLEEVQRIKHKFSELNLNPTYLEHEEVITSEDASRTRGFELKQGIKALVFTDGNDWVVVDIPADRKVDVKKVASQLNWSKSKIRMATEEEVMNKTGCQIGAVPPFGHKTPIPILVDQGIYDNLVSAFNIGLRTQSVKISTAEMKIVFNSLKVIEGQFTKL